MSDISDLLGDVDGFLTQVISSLEEDKIDVSEYELDHVCYKVETLDGYEHYKQQLKQLGELLGDPEIGGRPIATYKLHEPIIFDKREIYCVELPAPKPDKPPPEGLDHVEFVIDVSFEEFMGMYPHVKFDTEGSSKPINPDIKIKYGGFTVKFHHNSLEYVIEHEQKGT